MNTNRSKQNINVPPSWTYTQAYPEEEDQGLDVLTVKIMSLHLPDDDPRYYAVKVTFCDAVILSSNIKPIFSRCKEKERVQASGTLRYDPSDYGMICRFADSPLIVRVQPCLDGNYSSPSNSSDASDVTRMSDELREVCYCSVDILPLFTTHDKMCVKKRLEQAGTPSALNISSWDNLPLITMKLNVERQDQNMSYHEVLKNANTMRVTVVGAYNLMFPFQEDLMYTAATMLPVADDRNSQLMLFETGHRVPQHFNCTKFYPNWESQRIEENSFSKSNVKVSWNVDQIQNDSNIDLERHFDRSRDHFTVLWRSFHRTLMLDRSQRSLRKQILHWKWPLEVHLCCTKTPGFGYSYMAFLNLFQLLYPGACRMYLAVPLETHNSQAMNENSNCAPLLLTLTPPAVPLGSTLTYNTSLAERSNISVENLAFILVEIELDHPLVREHIPPHISGQELLNMLKEMEQTHTSSQCTGRGQSDRDWKSTVRHAVGSLRRVPHHGLTEYCIFNRQLSETRTRVEIFNSFWMDSAVYINNNFVVQDFVDDDKKFEELLMMGHLNLMRIAYNHLVGADSWHSVKPTLRAARQARHLQDIQHAMELYMQEAAAGPHNESVWRELGTCLRDVDRDWATICIDRAFLLDTKHPISLLSKASIVYEEDPDGAEIFFRAIIYLYPFWGTAWVIVNAYFHNRDLFNMADRVMEFYRLTLEDHQQENPQMPRSWDYELGDWWDPPPLLPGMSPYYDAADLLLRLRAISLAEVCISLALANDGESAVYYHMVGLCCRLRGQIEDALCFVRRGITNYGEVNYLRSLEGECLHLLNDQKAAMAAFEKAGANQGPYSTLLSLPRWEQPRIRPVLVDLLRRQPNACGWMALANDWMMRAEAGDEALGLGAGGSEQQAAAHTCAAACAVQALNWDRRAGRAWALLAKLAKPNAARMHYSRMAAACGYLCVEDTQPNRSRESLCCRLGRALKQCRCTLCDNIKI